MKDACSVLRISSEEIAKRVIVALDTSEISQAELIVGELRDVVGAFKVGLQLFTAAGPEFVSNLASRGIKVFLDLKYHDIPNTVAGAAVAAARLGVWMFNVHSLGGSEMIRTTVGRVNEVCGSESLARPLILGVTVLTSSSVETLAEIGLSGEPATEAQRLARLAIENGLDGIVSSAREAAAIRSSIVDRTFMIVTPGIRPSFATKDDQQRVTGLRQALAEGSDFAVIGRPITASQDRVRALEMLVSEI